MTARRYVVTRVEPSYAQGELEYVRVSPTHFWVELSTISMDGVNTVHGSVWVTLDTLDDLTHENNEKIRDQLIARKLLADSSVRIEKYKDETAPNATTQHVVALTEAQHRRWSAVVAIRDGLEVKGFPYLDKWFDSDERSVARITSTSLAAVASRALDRDFSVSWVCADDSTIDLTREQVIELPIAFTAYVGQIHAYARQLRERIYSASDVAEVKACLWEGIEDV